jgi:hypothetical protein
MAYLLCALLGTVVLVGICAPLFRKENGLESTILEETQWDLLQRKKEVVLGNIQDLDFEYKCGKLSEEDYKRVRAEMGSEFAAVRQEIDTIESSQDLDALIRREIAARRNKSATVTTAARSCPSCGNKNSDTNKFCAECGAKLKD